MRYILCSYEDALPLKKIKKELSSQTTLLVNHDLSLTGFSIDTLSSEEEVGVMKEIPNARISDYLPTDWKPFSVVWVPISTETKTSIGPGEIVSTDVESLRACLEDWVRKTGSKASRGGCQSKNTGDPKLIDNLISTFYKRVTKECSGVFVHYEEEIPVGFVSGGIVTDGYTNFFAPDVTYSAKEGKNNVMRVWHRYVRPFCEQRGITLRRSWVSKEDSNELIYAVHGKPTIYSNIDFPDKLGNLGDSLVSSTVEPSDNYFYSLVR